MAYTQAQAAHGDISIRFMHEHNLERDNILVSLQEQLMDIEDRLDAGEATVVSHQDELANVEEHLEARRSSFDSLEKYLASVSDRLVNHDKMAKHLREKTTSHGFSLNTLDQHGHFISDRMQDLERAKTFINERLESIEDAQRTAKESFTQEGEINCNLRKLAHEHINKFESWAHGVGEDSADLRQRQNHLEHWRDVTNEAVRNFWNEVTGLKDGFVAFNAHRLVAEREREVLLQEVERVSRENAAMSVREEMTMKRVDALERALKQLEVDGEDGERTDEGYEDTIDVMKDREADGGSYGVEHGKSDQADSGEDDNGLQNEDCEKASDENCDDDGDAADEADRIEHDEMNDDSECDERDEATEDEHNVLHDLMTNAPSKNVLTATHDTMGQRRAKWQAQRKTYRLNIRAHNSRINELKSDLDFVLRRDTTFESQAHDARTLNYFLILIFFALKLACYFLHSS